MKENTQTKGLRTFYGLHSTNYTRQSLRLHVRRTGECLATSIESANILSFLQQPSGVSVNTDNVLVIFPVGLYGQISVILTVPTTIAFFAGRQHDLDTAPAN